MQDYRLRLRTARRLLPTAHFSPPPNRPFARRPCCMPRRPGPTRRTWAASELGAISRARTSKARVSSTIASQNGRCFVECLVARRPAAPQIVVVQRRQIVVDQGVGVDHLNRQAPEWPPRPIGRRLPQPAGPASVASACPAQETMSHGVRQPLWTTVAEPVRVSSAALTNGPRERAISEKDDNDVLTRP